MSAGARDATALEQNQPPGRRTARHCLGHDAVAPPREIGMRSGGISTPCPFLSLWAFLFRQRNPHRRDRNAPVCWDLIRRTRAGEPSRRSVGSASLQDDHRVVSTDGTARSIRAAALTPERKSRHPTDIAQSECAFMAEGAVCISRGRGAARLLQSPEAATACDLAEGQIRAAESGFRYLRRRDPCGPCYGRSIRTTTE